MNIKILNAKKEYKGKEALYIDELNFNNGYIYALMGLNGSGKTTLLQCASGVETFTEGQILYDDSNDIDSVRKRISVMPQKPYLFNCSVADNIILGLKFRKLCKNDIKDRLNKYLPYFDLKGLLTKNSRQLSGGEQAKTALLRTAILETEVTFLDEPTASMDIDSTLRAEKLIKNMRSDTRSVILVTHDLLQAERTADYIIFLDRGRIIEKGEKDKVFNNPEHELLKKIFNKR